MASKKRGERPNRPDQQKLIGQTTNTGSENSDDECRTKKRRTLKYAPSTEVNGHVEAVETPKTKRGPGIVTPSTQKDAFLDSVPVGQSATRRNLFGGKKVATVTPARPFSSSDAPSAKRKLIFGRLVEQIQVKDNVKQVYGIVKKLTGSIGGNGSHGPIYGELTMGSMQKMVNVMKEHTGFCSSSRFIDVGSGIGKPNLHVAQDPGVDFSYGIEVEPDRFLLGACCLQGLLRAASQPEMEGKAKLGHRCIFERGDIRKAKTFNPFTHVYMFSIGFPPTLWVELSDMWNRSTSQYLVCYHGPKDIIHSYNFNVELLTQIPTSMHGSKEGHMGYIYQRTGATNVGSLKCDPAFEKAFHTVNEGIESITSCMDSAVGEMMKSGPSSRASRRSSSKSL